MWRLFRVWRSLCLNLLSSKQLLLGLCELAPENVCLLLVRVIAKPEVAIRVRVYKALQVSDLGSQSLTDSRLPGEVHCI